MDNIFYYITSFLLIINYVRGQGMYEDDACTSYGLQGVCKLISKCPESREIFLKYGTFPNNCGFKESEPIVCCTEVGQPQTSTTTRRTMATRIRTRNTSTTRTTTNVKKIEPYEDYAIGKLSEEKCIEYGKYVYEKVRPVTLIPGQKYENKSVCGFKAVELIVGGEKAKPYEFPHQALLGFENNTSGQIIWQCGGSLISENFVLTAAHCASTAELKNVKYVRLGELDYEDEHDDAQPQNFEISEIIKHPDWKPPKKYHDIMLVRLDKPVTFTKWVRPACLHTTFDIPATNSQSNIPRFIATGWGRIKYLGDSSTHLLKVTLDSFNQDRCKIIFKSTSKRYLPDGLLDKKQLCAGGNENKDTCQGDSGGPLQIYSQKVHCMYELAGITSFGKACGTEQVPGIYTRVSEYIDWIEKIVWKNMK